MTLALGSEQEERLRKALPIIRLVVDEMEAEAVKEWKVTDDERRRDKIWRYVQALGRLKKAFAAYE